MVALTGGAPPTSSVENAAVGAPADASHAITGHRSTEERIADALLACVGRWGLAKTTVEDIAREAGVSRATVYRLFPGGKAAIAEAAVRAEVALLVGTLRDRLEDIPDRTERLACAVWIASLFLAEHSGLKFLREHEPDEFERLVRMEHLDTLLLSSGELLGDVLAPVFDEPEQARDAAVWLARIVASHVANPSPSLDLTDLDQARWTITTFVVPGLAVDTTAQPDPRTTDPSPSRSTQ